MHDKKPQLEPDMEQQTGSKLGKEFNKVVYCHTVYLTFMQSTSCKVLGWINHKLESRLPGESQGGGEPRGLPSMGLHRVGHD